MTATTLLFVLLILACPLMMVFMHRGGRGDAHDHDPAGRESASLDELRGRREMVDETSAHERR